MFAIELDESKDVSSCAQLLVSTHLTFCGLVLQGVTQLFALQLPVPQNCCPAAFFCIEDDALVWHLHVNTLTHLCTSYHPPLKQ